MIQRTVPASEAGGREHRAMHVVEAVLDRRLQIAAQREARGDGRGQGAPGAMCRCGEEPRPGESSGPPGRNQEVGHHFGLQMTAFDERCAGAEFEEPAPGPLHLGRVPDLEIGEDGGFIEVRRDQRREREQPVAHDRLGRRIEEPVARGGHHHRIADVRPPATIADGIGDLAHQGNRGEHPCLDRGRRQILGEGVELRGDHEAWHRVHGAHAVSILRCERDDDAGPEYPELLKCLEVGLNAGTATGIGPGDCERNLHREGVVGVTLISTIRDLHRRRARERRALTLVEGVRLLEEALAAGIPVQGAVTSAALEGTPRGTALKRRLVLAGVPIETIDDDLLAQLADTEQPQGVVAVIEPRQWELDAIQPGPRGVVLVLDGVQDPGNVGALARTALGLGAAGIVALPGTADIHNPKALRGSMGALFRLPTVQATTEAFIGWARGKGLSLWTTAADGAPVDRVRREGPVALILGNEGAGVRPELAVAATQSVSVPLVAGVESLNVAVAAGIILYEVTRDR